MNAIQFQRPARAGILCVMVLVVLHVASGAELAETTQPESEEETIKSLRDEVESLRKENDDLQFYIVALRKEVVELRGGVNRDSDGVTPHVGTPTTKPIAQANKGGNTTQPAGSSKLDRLEDIAALLTIRAAELGAVRPPNNLTSEQALRFNEKRRAKVDKIEAEAVGKVVTLSMVVFDVTKNKNEYFPASEIVAHPSDLLIAFGRLSSLSREMAQVEKTYISKLDAEMHGLPAGNYRQSFMQEFESDKSSKIALIGGDQITDWSRNTTYKVTAVIESAKLREVRIDGSPSGGNTKIAYLPDFCLTLGVVKQTQQPAVSPSPSDKSSPAEAAKLSRPANSYIR